ncbi:MAG: tetratricopeptide repeat protein [Pirellulales bacterium]
MNTDAKSRSRGIGCFAGSCVFLVALALFAIRDALYATGHDAWASWLLVEDGPVETLGATCALLAGLIFGLAYFARPQANHFWRWSTRRNLFFLAAAVVLLLMFLEEISWGQRLFGIETPIWLARHNSIGELNLHNLILFQPDRSTNYLQGIWIIGTLSYLGLLPLARAVIRPLARRLERWALPVPSLAIAAALWSGLLVRLLIPAAAAPIAAYTRSQEAPEVLELVCEFLLWVLAVQVLVGASNGDTPAPRGAWLSVAVSVVCLLAVAGWQWVGQTRQTIESAGRLAQGKHLAAAGQTAEARRALVEAVALSPQNAQALLRLGALDLNAGAARRAATSFAAAVQVAPDNAEGRYLYGLSLLIEGKTVHAVEQLDTAVKLAPRNAGFRQQLGMALLSAGRLDEAAEQTAAAVELAPRLAEVHASHAQVLERRGEFAAAVDHLEIAQELAPTSTAVGEQLRRTRELLESSGQSTSPGASAVDTDGP